MYVVIRPMQSDGEGHVCTSAIMCSEPWLTLRLSPENAWKAVTDPSRESYVAIDGAEIAGFIVLNLIGPLRGYIQLLCVLPSWQGKGVGTSLLTFAEQRVFREHPNVFLMVSSFNDKAQKFYAKLGYKRVGEVADYVIKGHSEYIMRKTIAALRDFSPRTSG